MEEKILIKAGIKKHKGSLIGIALLVFLSTIALFMVFTLKITGEEYVSTGIQKTEFGDLTAWVSEVDDTDSLLTQINDTQGVEAVWMQELIYSDYESATAESDSEGQLIAGDEDKSRYRFFKDDLSGYQDAPQKIMPNEIYVPASMISVLNVQIGDSITFKIARGHNSYDFTVAGYFEDPVMGSSMIGMKTFMISSQSYAQIVNTINEEGADALARMGAALHITKDRDSALTTMELSERINDNTGLPVYTESMYSADTMRSFMLVFQNAFGGILAAFAIILLVVVMIMLGYSISGMIEEDWKNIGILKTIGMKANTLIFAWTIQYMCSVILGLLLGWIVTLPLNHLVSLMLVTSSGVLIPPRLPFVPCLMITIIILVLMTGFIVCMLHRSSSISPMDAIREAENKKTGKVYHSVIVKKGLSFWLAMRQILSGKKRYIGACLVAVLLTFFTALAGRVNVWLGSDGKGMMDAFNPADHDLGIQIFGTLSLDEMEQEVTKYTDITDRYMLAMQDVSVNGRNYTANVITEPDRFHISKGETCVKDDQIVITEVIAKDLGLEIGDTVQLKGDAGMAEFVVSGIYHCANDMGENIGISREGYFRIGQDDERIWCHHYFISDTAMKDTITQELQSKYGGDVHVHENTWPGLFGIINAMHLLLLTIYILSFVFIGIVTYMTGVRIVDMEQKNMGIFKAIGFPVRELRVDFACRFGIIAVIGAVFGAIMASIFTDPIVGAIMRLAGISNFKSRATIMGTLVPGFFIVISFVVFAYLTSAKIVKNDMNILMDE